MEHALLMEMESARCPGNLPNNITDLADAALAHVSSYLANPSRALFAVAFTAPTSSWCSCNSVREPAASKAILGNNGQLLEVLDFEQIEDTLACRLTDDDIHSLLICIKAAEKLRKIRLAGCTNVVGHGLELLRGALVLEHVDLSLTKLNENSDVEQQDVKISEIIVLPILDSIVDEEENSLKFIHLPMKWRGSRSQRLAQFLQRYNNLLESRMGRCSRCAGLCRQHEEVNPQFIGDDFKPWVEQPWSEDRHEDHLYFYGTQNYTCYKCAKNFCSRRNCQALILCVKCSKEYCTECVPEVCVQCETCTGCANMDDSPNRCDCGRAICNKCIMPQCEVCNRSACSQCVDFAYCEFEGCGTICCENCRDRGFGTCLEQCEWCGSTYCTSHRIMACRQADNACRGCLILPTTSHYYCRTISLAASCPQRGATNTEPIILLKRNLHIDNILACNDLVQ